MFIAASNANAAEPFFGRGVNIGNTLEAPPGSDWARELDKDHLQLIADAGFDSIRLPVKWSAYAGEMPPYSIDPGILQKVTAIMDQATEAGLNVILNIHHFDGMDADPETHQDQFLAIWDQLASRFADRPASVAFEVLNEPHDQLTSDKWNKALADAVAVIRKTNPTRKILAGPVQWNNIEALETLVFPNDDNMVMTFHYYSPFEFTHQNASWVSDDSTRWAGTTWTGTDAEKAEVRKDFDKAQAWGREHGVPVYLGEFGAYQAADMESRIRWTRFIADEAVKRDFGIAYWEFYAGFGLYDSASRSWNEGLRDAVLGAK